MRKNLVLTSIILIAAIVLSSCNLPFSGGQEPTTSEMDLVNTAAAETVIALSTRLAAGETETPNVIVITATNAPATQTSTPAPTATQAAATATYVPITAVPVTSVPVLCDRADFIADVTIPDNTVITPGASFVKTWRLRNSGSCTWSTSYRLVFDSGNAMSGPATVSLPTSVAPGQTVDVSVTLTAPSSSGTYQGFWKLQNASGVRFGIGANANVAFWVKIISGSGSTAVPTSSTGLSCSVALDSPSNYSEFTTNADFDGRWTLTNNGSDTWTAADLDFRYLSGTKMHEGADAYDMPADVASGASTDLVLDMVAPSSAGTYSTTWGLMLGGSTVCTMSFTIRVVNP